MLLRRALLQLPRPQRMAAVCRVVSDARRFGGPARVLMRHVLAVLWILWAYTPDWVLKSLGITYYPDRYWAIALPMYGMCLVGYLIIIYNAWNLCNTNPFESYYTVRGACPRRSPDRPPAVCASRVGELLTLGRCTCEQTPLRCQRRPRTRTCRHCKPRMQYRQPRTSRSRRSIWNCLATASVSNE